MGMDIRDHIRENLSILRDKVMKSKPTVTESSEFRFCIYCKYYSISNLTGHQLCLHPSVQLTPKLDLVTGKMSSRRELEVYCDTIRMDIRECKPEGLLYEPK